MHERIERQPLLALVDVLTKEATDSGSPLFENYLRTDLNTLQIWSPDEDSTLIAMVIYTKQVDSVSCLLALLPQHRTHIISHFPRYFVDRMCQFAFCKRIRTLFDIALPRLASTIPKLWTLLT